MFSDYYILEQQNCDCTNSEPLGTTSLGLTELILNFVWLLQLLSSFAKLLPLKFKIILNNRTVKLQNFCRYLVILWKFWDFFQIFYD